MIRARNTQQTRPTNCKCLESNYCTLHFTDNDYFIWFPLYNLKQHLKKLLLKLGLQPKKVKVIPRVNFAFVTFRWEVIKWLHMEAQPWYLEGLASSKNFSTSQGWGLAAKCWKCFSFFGSLPTSCMLGTC